MILKDTVIDWLLEENQPSVRYLALTELLGRSEKDAEVKSTKESIAKIGWTILERQNPGGYWIGEKRRPDGRWNLDSVNPDSESPQARWDKDHPKQASIPFALERPGEPSKMITLNSLKILRRLGEVG
jgi:hypothetical protein